MHQCRYCGNPLTESPICPFCGRTQQAEPSPWETATAPITKYFRTLFQIVFRPVQFFRHMPTSGGVSGPLAFALITHWIGSACEFLWRSMIGGRVAKFFSDMFQVAGDVADVDHPGRSVMIDQVREQLVHWFWGAGSIVADPFLTLASILFTSLFVFVGARILITPGRAGVPREITFESALRIVCFGLSPAIIAAFPLVGGAISAVWILVVTVIGAREVYKIGTGRAIVVALFPKLLFLGILLTGLVLFMAMIIKIIAPIF